MSPHATIRIDADLLTQVRNYATITSTPINRVVEQAVEAHMPYLHSELQHRADLLKKRPGGFISAGDAELLSRQDQYGRIHLHDGDRDLTPPVAPPAVDLRHTPKGFLEGLEPKLADVPKLLQHHSEQIALLLKLVEAEGCALQAIPVQSQARHKK